MESKKCFMTTVNYTAFFEQKLFSNRLEIFEKFNNVSGFKM